MARRFTRTRGRLGSQRRESLWLFFPTSEVNLAAASTAVLGFSLNAAALALRPFTIVRTRLTWHTRSDQSAATELWGTSLGMCVVSDQASAIGVTAVPTPITDQGSDLFFVYEENYGAMLVSTVVGFTDVGRRVEVDSKAMRRVNDDEDMVVTFENTAFTPSGANIIGGRILIKLH